MVVSLCACLLVKVFVCALDGLCDCLQFVCLCVCLVALGCLFA